LAAAVVAVEVEPETAGRNATAALAAEADHMLRRFLQLLTLGQLHMHQ
jgi:hypothetical protein